MSYDDLPISNDGMTMDAYHLMCQEQDPQQRQLLRDQLTDYCRLDTEAMVRLLETLQALSGGK